MSLAAGIVNYQDYDSLPACLDSLLSQTLPLDEIFVYDNSQDAVRRATLQKAYPKAVFFSDEKNTGYAGGANALIRRAASSHILVLNPDVVLFPDYVQKVADIFQKEPRAGIIGGKLLRDDEILDSTGISLTRARRVSDRGHGQKDAGQFPSGDVFAICGAAIALRREMLEDVALEGEYFDEVFFVYHEDTDLAWRAHLRNWRVIYSAEARAFHRRGWAREKSRADVSPAVRVHSYKNRYLELIKNEPAALFWRDAPFILIWEFVRFCGVLLKEPLLLKAYWRVLTLLPDAWRKRRAVQARRLCSIRDLSSFIHGNI